LRKNKNKKTKTPETKTKKEKHLPPFEVAVGCRKPLFQLAVAACQPAATQSGPAAIVANLPPFAAAAGSYYQLKRR
jgi:hypothetical protein